MNSIKVSVIIPVYNTAPYLRECLDSICRQTLAQIEIICVNDGSTDESLSILQQYAQKDERVVICTQENRGQSSARNKGAALAHGEYLYFMDSDDMLEITALEMLYGKAKNDSLDIIYFGGDSFTSDLGYEERAEQYTKYYKRNFSYEGIYKGWMLLSQMMKNDEYRVQPCLQLINKDYYVRHKLDFYEGIIHEDNLFNYKCMLQADRVEYLPMKLFHRRIRPDSTMTKKVTFAHVYGYFMCHLEMRRFYKEQSLEKVWDDMVFLPVKEMLRNARNQYQKLLPEEKQEFLDLLYDQRELFELYITDVCNERDKAKNLQGKIRLNEEKIKSTESRLKNTEETLARTESRLKNTEETLARTESRLKNTEETLTNTESRLKNTEETLANTESRLKNTEETLASTENRLKNTEETLASTENRMKNTEETLTNTESRLKNTEETLTNTESRLKNTEETLASTESRLKNTENKLKLSLSREKSLKQSVSFRIGRAITWGPRKIRDEVRSLK